MSDREKTARKILLTGASGYVGGRLLSLLEQRGYNVRCLSRRPDEFRSKVGPGTEVVQGDAMDKDSLVAALEGIDTAFYLIHSMGANKDFESLDRKAATNFAEAASKAGVRRIIYLGGLGTSDQNLSKHLRSRHETGDVLRESDAEVIELRASIIIGSGSLSFELVRSLVERLPMMVCPRWVSVTAQPISIEDILKYLADAIEFPRG